MSDSGPYLAGGTVSPAVENAAGAFREVYGHAPAGVWIAPGRVNLIGEHTDYNDGYVLPFALPQHVAVAVAKRGDNVLRLRSSHRPSEPARVDLAELTTGRPLPRLPGWARYLAGMAWSLVQSSHRVGGVEVMVASDLPEGTGLSSSAALECALGLALTDLFGLQIRRPALARAAQHAENEFVGMPCGIMDQSAALLARSGHALFLDTRDFGSEHVPFDVTAADLTLLAIDTSAPHQLVGGAYAARRRDCETAAARLGVAALRDVDDLESALRRLDEPRLRRRTRHVVTENRRVLDVVSRLRTGEVANIGTSLITSHTSLRDDYEVSWPEADAAVDAVLAAGALGARMVGGGFGGCVIALVPARTAEEVTRAVEETYARRGYRQPRLLPATPSAGAHRAR